MPTQIARKYTIFQLTAMPEERLTQVIAADYNALVAISISDASRPDTPPHIRRLLRSPEWRFTWLDALACAEGTLQVSLERMTYEGDTRIKSIRSQLYFVRNALREARALARQEQMLEVRDARELDVENTATRWLCEAFQDEHKEIRREVEADNASVTEDERYDEAFDAIVAAWQAGKFDAPLTDDLKDLMRLGPAEFRDVVAKDAQSQGEPCLALRHPLALSKWRAALVELLESTWERAKADSPHWLGPLRADLYVLSQEEAFSILNARRFLAAVQQRHAEATRAIRLAILATPGANTGFLHPRQRRARITDERLVADRKREYDYIVNRLLDYCADDCTIDPEKLTRDIRGEVKRQVIAEVRGEAPTRCPDIGEPANDPLDALTVDKQTAYALAVMDLEICHRSTIRAMLPEGTIRQLPNPLTRRREGKRTSVNRTSDAFQRVLRRFEQEGYIQRGEEFVRILERRKLYDYALSGLDALPDGFVDYAAAESIVRADVESAPPSRPRAWLEQRHLELDRLRALMAAAPSSRQPRVVLRTGRQERLEVGQHRTPRAPKGKPQPVRVTRGAPNPPCKTCRGKPPAGFACRTCGTEGGPR